jgi:hypothetical protein
MTCNSPIKVVNRRDIRMAVHGAKSRTWDDIAVKHIDANWYFSDMPPEGMQRSQPQQVVVPPRHSPYLLTLREAW